MDVKEAQLFRLLVSFFGEDRVVPFMSVKAVCGGGVPQSLPVDVSAGIQRDTQCSVEAWARASRCLFTVVNEQDCPCLVVEFFESFERIVEVKELMRRRYLPPVLAAAAVHYVTISLDELADIMDPESSFTLTDFLEARLDLSTRGAA